MTKKEKTEIVNGSETEWSTEPARATLETLIKEIDGTRSAMEMLRMREDILHYLKQLNEGS